MKQLNFNYRMMLLCMLLLGAGVISAQAQYSGYAIEDAVVFEKSPDMTGAEHHNSNLFIAQSAAQDSLVISYVKFDITGLYGKVVSKAEFSTRSDMNDGTTMTVMLRKAEDGFSRDTTNWNNKPSSSGELATVIMDENSNRKVYVENGTALVDYINGKLMSGATEISFALKYKEGSGEDFKWCGGKGDGSWGPLLEMEFATEGAYYANEDAVVFQKDPEKTGAEHHNSNIFISQNEAGDSAVISYVRFYLEGMAYKQVGIAQFSTRSDMNDGTTLTVKLTGSNDHIDRDTTNWNNKPSSSGDELASVIMDENSDRKVYVENGTALVDYINAQLASGDEMITFALKYKEGSGTDFKWCGGKGDGSWGPMLEISEVTHTVAAYDGFAIDDAVVFEKDPDKTGAEHHAGNLFISQNEAGDSAVISYVKFSLAGLDGRTVSSVMFSTRSDMNDGTTMTVKLTGADTDFDRDTTSWNNRPNSSANELAAVIMDENSDRKVYVENGTALVDYINGKLMAGATEIAFALKYKEGSGTDFKWCGGAGDGAWGPQLKLEFSNEGNYYATDDAVVFEKDPDKTGAEQHASNIFISQNEAGDSAVMSLVKFNLAGLAYTEITGVEFSTRSDMNDGTTMTVKLTGAGTDFHRDTTSWNNKPSIEGAELATVIMDQESNRKTYVETGTAMVDYINSKLATGNTELAFALQYKSGDGEDFKWCGGKGDGSWGPMLKLTSPTLTPDADTILILEDAFVDEEDPDTNKDSSSDMQIRKDDAGGTAKEVYLKFDISGAADAIAGKANLRLYIAQHSSGTQQDDFFAEVFAVDDQGWTETTITWNNKPAAGKKLLEENVTWFNAGKDTLWSSIDLTHYFNDAVADGKETISLTIRGKADTPGDRLWMAESNWKPLATQLILDYTVDPPERSCSIVADAHVEQENPDANFGSEADQHLINDDSNNKSKWVFQKFDISNAYENLISATLRVYARIHSSAADITTFSFGVYGVNNNEWLENEITWNNKPGVAGTLFFQATATPDGGYFNLSSAAFTEYVNAAIEDGKDSISVAIKGLDETPGNRAWISGRTYKAPELILNYEKQASQPVFSPEPGDFIAEVSVEISTLTSGATIYYTTDGSDPDDASTEYTEAIVLTDTTIIKAVAYAPDLKASPLAIGTYFVTPVGLPMFSPSPVPKYQPPVEVTISVEPEDAVIRYSDDGSDPTTLYTDPLILEQTTTLKAQAFSADFTYSTDIVEVTYTIIPPTGTAGTGPGGVGYKDLSRTGQPELSLWLAADGISGATDGSEITEWADASGNENNGYNTWVDGGDNKIPNTGESQKQPPVYREGVLNGLPVLEFGAAEGEKGSIVVDDADNLDGGDGLSIFMVARRNEMFGDFAALIQKRDITSDNSQRAYVFEMNGGANPNEMQFFINREFVVRNDSIIDDERYYLFNVGLNGDLDLGYFITNGFMDATAAYAKPLNASHAPVIIGGFQSMNIAEVVAYNSSVNMAQTLIIHEYLAAKYGLALVSADGMINMYDHDTYTADLIGVGKAGDLTGSAEEEHLHATGGALELKADGFAAAGDFVLAAHNGAAITEDANKVWSRVWHVKTAGDGGNVEMVFDFARAGLTLESADGYILSYRATGEDDWVDLGIAPTKDGDKLVFSVSAIADGYYAVGQGLPGSVSTGPDQLVRGFSLYPNPATETVNLLYSSDHSNMVSIHVYDFTGRVVHTSMVMNATGNLETRIDLTGFEKGMYTVEIRDGDTRAQKTLLVQ